MARDGMTAGGICQVVWTRPSSVTAGDAALLDEAERARLSGFRRPGNRTRFLCAAVLLRRMVSIETGVPPAQVTVDRTCGSCPHPHGRPRLTGLGLYASIAHSGDRVGVALTQAGPVGLDVERLVARDVTRLAGRVLGDGEHSGCLVDFYRYWTRKESVVKATGAGIVVGLRRVQVSPPDEPPRLLHYLEEDSIVASMSDLAPGGDYVACLTVLGIGSCAVDERWCWTGIGREALTDRAGRSGRPG